MEDTRRCFSFQGRTSTAFGIFMKGLLLTIGTLGLYWPWALTERRRYFWGNTEFEGSRFRYSGRGADLFRGVLLVSGLYGLVGMLVAQAFRWLSPKTGVISVGVILLVYLFYVYPRLLLGSYRYRASRSEWRGIRFRIEAGFRDFYAVYFRGLLLTILSFGIYAPLFLEDLFAFGITRLHLGTKRFRYEGDRLEFAFQWFLHFVVFGFLSGGLYLPWARARLLAIRVGRIRWGDARLESRVSGLSFLGFSIRSFLAPLTLFLIHPSNAVNRVRKLVEGLSWVGPLEPASIEQVAGVGGQLEEAGSLLFGFDLGFDFG